jgi:proteasome assembly chaperone (PAC2) family protein
MADNTKFRNPWLVAVWPGMGQVALTAGYYLMTKLEMEELAELPTHGSFDLDSVDVQHGLVQPPRVAKSRFFGWNNPSQDGPDLILFVGDAQPAINKMEFCHRLLAFAKRWNIQRVITFAAMVTQSAPDAELSLWGAATDKNLLDDLKNHQVMPLVGGQIGGLNGLLIGAGVDKKLPGICLLGELPQMFVQIAYPKSALPILEAFERLTGVPLKLHELRKQVDDFDEHLRSILAQNDETQNEETTQESTDELESDANKLAPSDQTRIEELFDKAQRDRAQAYELKRELDRLNVFSEYENRFLDLFKRDSDL